VSIVVELYGMMIKKRGKSGERKSSELVKAIGILPLFPESCNYAITSHNTTTAVAVKI